MCDIPQIKRNIRGVRKNIKKTNKQISRLEKRKAKVLISWNRGLEQLEDRIRVVTNALEEPKRKQLDSIENFIKNRKADVESSFAQILDRLNSECSQRQSRFDEAIEPLMLKLQINIALRNKLQQDYDNDPDVQKINTRAKLMAQDRFVRDLQAQIDGNQTIHNDRMKGCSPSDPGSIGDQKNKALAYWDNIRQRDVDYVNSIYPSSDNNPLLVDLNREKQFIINRLANINNGYDSKINQYRVEIAFYEAQLRNLTETLSACLNNRRNNCEPVSMPICLPGYKLVASEGDCPQYTCEQIA